MVLGDQPGLLRVGQAGGGGGGGRGGGRVRLGLLLGDGAGGEHVLAVLEQVIHRGVHQLLAWTQSQIGDLLADTFKYLLNESSLRI